MHTFYSSLRLFANCKDCTSKSRCIFLNCVFGLLAPLNIGPLGLTFLSCLPFVYSFSLLPPPRKRHLMLDFGADVVFKSVSSWNELRSTSRGRVGARRSS